MTTAEFEAIAAACDPVTLSHILSNPQPWAETFLANPTGGRFHANYVQTQILGSQNRFNVVRVHRRAGKSYSIAILTLFYCLMVDSCQVLIITPAGSQVKELFTTLREFLRVNEWMQDYVVRNHENPHRIEFKNGSRVTGFTTGARSKGKGMNLRGQGADVIFIDEAAYLNEDDWLSLKPILQGDSHRRFPPRVFCCSTPAYTRGAYYRMCKELSQNGPDVLEGRKKALWHEIHVAITANPSLSEEFVAQARELAQNELEWTQEWLAEFPDVGEGVFPKRMVDRSLTDYSIEEYLANAKASWQGNPAKREAHPSRTMGVDWDKFNADGHGPNIAILEAQPEGKYRVIYHEEIPQSEMCLHIAVDRICELDGIFNCDWIYVDYGKGDYQVEEFGLRGMSKKVVGVHFAETVKFPLPGGGIQKKRFKQAMISLLRTWFERGYLELPRNRRSLWNQFLEYHIVSQSETTLKFSTENEHGIDAVGLAAMAMHQRIKNPYKPKVATEVRRVEAPSPLSGNLIREGLRQGKSAAQTYLEYREAPNTFSRSTLGSCGPSSRTMF